MFESRAGKASVLVLLGTISSAQSQDLPAGTIQAKVNTACAECHDAGIIRQQRLSEKVWTKELDKMIKWGALVDPADRTAFIKYLSESSPPTSRRIWSFVLLHVRLDETHPDVLLEEFGRN